MDKSSLSPSDISALIDYLLKSKDPATVGLRKILREKNESGRSFPLQSLDFEEFFVQGKSKEPFSKEERAIIGLEKRINDLQELLTRSENELPRRLEQSRDEGLREGMKKGEAAAYEKTRADYEAQVDALQKRVSAFLADVEGSKKSIYANAHTILLDLAYKLARKIIQAEVTLNPDIILGVIKKSMTYISDRERIIVRVSKDDLENVSKNKNFWMPVGERLESIIIEPDDRIEKGGCIIESNSGVVDARLGVQFDELRDLVEKTWESVSASDTLSGESPAGGPR
jgi:flagellar biosynthesis/type III secretory pathway protein FliH